MKLIIAEKPSVGLSISSVVGAKTKKDGYYEGNNYIVSWGLGHLVGLAANPSDYKEEWKKWDLNYLPMIPDEFKHYIINKKQFNVLKKLLNDKKVDEVINACDAGREGELIFRLIYNEAQCTKPIKRLWISSMEDNAIKDGINNLKNGEDYNNLYKAAIARQRCDWLIGMNLSRYYGIKNNIKGCSIGRVKTPILNMIIERENYLKNFVPIKYYQVEIETNKGVFTSSEHLQLNKAKEIINLISNSVVVDKVETKEKVDIPDLLYDLTTLQREANKFLGYSASKTLEILQSLYEKKLVTYPRTDSRYLTEDMKNTIIEYFNSINHKVNDKNFTKIFNSKKVSDHHAIIPTKTSINIDYGFLSDDQKNIFNLIKNKTLASVSENFVQEQTNAFIKLDNILLKASGNVIKNKGFTIFSYGDKKEKFLDKIKENEVLEVKNKKINEKYTKPNVSSYSEDTLLKDMENAGKDEHNKDIEIERAGIGTPATRAGIIDELIKKDFIKKDKKKLLPTEKAINLIVNVDKVIKTPTLTVKWEERLTQISKGEDTYKSFMIDTCKMLEKIIKEK